MVLKILSEELFKQGTIYESWPNLSLDLIQLEKLVETSVLLETNFFSLVCTRAPLIKIIWNCL
jgi:hypothetical protein